MVDVIFKQLDLPSVPDSLLPKNYISKTILWNPPLRSCLLNGISQDNCDYTRYQVPDNLLFWIQNNIASDTCEEGFCHLGGANIGLPHTDKNRDWTLLWLWDLGGNEVDTVFWQEVNKPFYRPEQVLPTDYNDLIEIARARFQLGSWWLLNARTIHSIENLTRTRHSIQLGFKNDSKSIAHWTKH